MANEVLIKQGTAIVWADTTDYVDPTTGGVLARTHQIDLTSLASAAARQGAKADLGATRARRYAVILRVEFDVAPTAGDIVSCFISESPSSTAGEVNPGGVGGTDSAYVGYSGGNLADSIKQLRHVGNMVVENVAATTVQYQQIGIVEDLTRYITPVLYNQADQAFEGDAIEMLFGLIPLIDEVQ